MSVDISNKKFEEIFKEDVSNEIPDNSEKVAVFINFSSLKVDTGDRKWTIAVYPSFDFWKTEKSQLFENGKYKRLVLKITKIGDRLSFNIKHELNREKNRLLNNRIGCHSRLANDIGTWLIAECDAMISVLEDRYYTQDTPIIVL